MFHLNTSENHLLKSQALTLIPLLSNYFLTCLVSHALCPVRLNFILTGTYPFCIQIMKFTFTLNFCFTLHEDQLGGTYTVFDAMLYVSFILPQPFHIYFIYRVTSSQLTRSGGRHYGSGEWVALVKADKDLRHVKQNA